MESDTRQFVKNRSFHFGVGIRMKYIARLLKGPINFKNICYCSITSEITLERKTIALSQDFRTGHL